MPNITQSVYCVEGLVMEAEYTKAWDECPLFDELALLSYMDTVVIRFCIVVNRLASITNWK
jgi:hypothetical protein